MLPTLKTQACVKCRRLAFSAVMKTECHPASSKVHCWESALNLVCLVDLIFILSVVWPQGSMAPGCGDPSSAHVTHLEKVIQPLRLSPSLSPCLAMQYKASTRHKRALKSDLSATRMLQPWSKVLHDNLPWVYSVLHQSGTWRLIQSCLMPQACSAPGNQCAGPSPLAPKWEGCARETGTE